MCPDGTLKENNAGVELRKENIYVSQTSSPYQHLRTSGRESQSSPYTELNNDIWNEIFKGSKESLASVTCRSLPLESSKDRESYFDVWKEIFPIGNKTVASKNNTSQESVKKYADDSKEDKENHRDVVKDEGERTFVGAKLEVNNLLQDGGSYDCIRYSAHIPGGDQLLKLQGHSQGGNDVIKSRPLPVVPLYEPLDIVTHTSGWKKTVSHRRMWLMIAATVFVLCTIVVGVVIYKTTENSGEFSAKSFVNTPTLLHVISGNRAIRGIAVLNDQMFVTRAELGQLQVYDNNNFIWIRNITIEPENGTCLWAIIASPIFNCLYITDNRLWAVHVYNLSNNIVTKFEVGGESYGLSFTSTHNILVTVWKNHEVREYSPYGSLIRTITLDKGILNPDHCIQWNGNGDRFIVSHGSDFSSSVLHRLCVIEASGAIVQCYGGVGGDSVTQWRKPRHMAMDRYGNVLVADQGNSRVVVLNPSLSHYGYVTVPGYILDQPWEVYLDERSQRLYIGEETHIGRIFILKA